MSGGEDQDRFADEERELDRLLARVRPIADEAGELRAIQTAIAAEAGALSSASASASAGDDLTCALAVFDKWRLIHRYVHARPFRLNKELPRSDQWREVAQIYAPLGDDELDDWITLQIEVAQARAKGQPDYRIRRDGPCFIIALEYVANRKRTALAVLHWARSEAG